MPIDVTSLDITSPDAKIQHLSVIVDEVLSQFIQNEIPTRLIYVPNARLVDKTFIFNHFRPTVHQSILPLTRYLSNMLDGDPTILFTHLQVIIRTNVSYVMFSHRWGEGEPTYTLEKLKGKSPGYQKLKMFLDEASERGFALAWSDTCCIDKTSSAELDEAIRSMFRWYRNSALCIVHLAQTIEMDDINKDEWFRRAWTLQELLAPWRIKFLNKEWIPLTDDENDKFIVRSRASYGDVEDLEVDPRKYTLIQKVSAVTRIPEILFSDDFSNHRTPVADKLVWAAGRVSTRREDMAYSLMGLLGVSIQSAYGEGGNRAFRRLLEAIITAFGPRRHVQINWEYGTPHNIFGEPLASSLGMSMAPQGLHLRLFALHLVPSSPQSYTCPALNNVVVELPRLYVKRLRSYLTFALGIITYYPTPAGVHTSQVALPPTLATYILGSFGTRPSHAEHRPFEGVEHEGRPRGWSRVVSIGWMTKASYNLVSEILTVNIPGSDVLFPDSFFFVDTSAGEFADVHIPHHKIL